MEKWVCTVCGYVYDPEVGDPDNGVEPDTPFEELPEDWVCPACGVGKDMFEQESYPGGVIFCQREKPGKAYFDADISQQAKLPW